MSDVNTAHTGPTHQDDESFADDGCEVIVLTKEEYLAGVENTIRTSGFTREELKRQAAEGRFESTMAKRTWFAVADYL